MAKLVQHSPAKRELLQETKLVTDAVAELECLVENTALSMSLMKTKPCNSPSKDTLVYLASNGGKFTPVLTGGVEELVANLDQILATRSDQDIRLICQEVREYRIYLENFIKSRSPQVMGGGDHLVSTFSLDTIPVAPAVSQGTMCSLGSFSSTDTLSYKQEVIQLPSQMENVQFTIDDQAEVLEVKARRGRKPEPEASRMAASLAGAVGAWASTIATAWAKQCHLHIPSQQQQQPDTVHSIFETRDDDDFFEAGSEMTESLGVASVDTLTTTTTTRGSVTFSAADTREVARFRSTISRGLDRQGSVTSAVSSSTCCDWSDNETIAELVCRLLKSVDLPSESHHSELPDLEKLKYIWNKIFRK